MPTSTTLPRLLGRGAAAGGLGGLLAGGFSYLLAEPIMDRAVRLEAARHAADGHEHTEEVFTRTQQHLGLIGASVIAGVALGVLFAVVYAALHRRDPDGRPWERSLALAGAGLLGIWLLPFLRYPANPPGVGDEATVGLRTASWLGAIAIGAAAVVVAWRVYSQLDRAAPPVRQGAGAGVVIAGLAVLFLLPDNPDPVDVPARLLWDFRMLSAAASVLLWASLGVAFGALGLRAAASARSADPASPPVSTASAP
ncbi:MAG TPA: CbtA family protein [Streptosporangiaceae bacterium]|nr:CbtA family protein [Streptosporangiaceae bacterium]